MKRIFTCILLVLASGAPALAADVCLSPAITNAPLTHYRTTLESCRTSSGETRLITRRFQQNGHEFALSVAPETLETAVADPACWRCEASELPPSRLSRAIEAAANANAGDMQPLTNAGIKHGTGEGSFLTLDLCPSPKALDRDFLAKLQEKGKAVPLAFAISGGWLTRHPADFEWLMAQQAAGAFAITWVNHSSSHPYIPGLPNGQNFLLKAGVNIEREVLETEKLLIMKGATPSVFFRFPGLVADRALLEKLKALHLVPLGADSWLAKGAKPKAGAIILLHANGNEPFGLSQYRLLAAKGALPLPFRPLTELP